ncbi:MAG TPA: aldehyde dehydrogenase family protein [candidate division Zixibacteria bacterium]|nr:aldehyde dehydrogenase family protein [candidate division Zixibacteria bacterium]
MYQPVTYAAQLPEAPQAAAIIDVTSPYTGEIVGRVHEATPDIIDHAFATAERAQREILPRLNAADRARILQRTADLVEAHTEDYALMIALEGGKPLSDARAETVRAVNTLRLSATVALTLAGETPVMDQSGAGAAKISFTLREPIGVVSSISAFNHPLNLAAHLVGPAFAAGNAVVLKPATTTPLCSMKLGRHFLEAGLPPEALGIIDCEPPLAELCVTDERIRFLNFIGSEKVGWQLRGKLPAGARLMLEHGGTAPAIVAPDADLDRAARACVKGGFYHAGQVCVSLQRLYLHERIYDDFMARFSPLVNDLKVGDPTLPETEVGPLIRPAALDRVEQWVKEAVAQGAKLTDGGARLDHNCYAPTILEHVKPGMKVHDEEIFGPVVVVLPYRDLDTVISAANNSPYAFQSSIFTSDVNTALYAARRLDSTGVMINDHPAFRVDWMPFGGRKASGIGMGGVRYAAEEMSQLKIINIHNP